MADSVDNNNSTSTETAIESLSLEDKEDFVDPWNVESQSDTGIDYDKLIRKNVDNMDWLFKIFVQFTLFIDLHCLLCFLFAKQSVLVHRKWMMQLSNALKS